MHVNVLILKLIFIKKIIFVTISALQEHNKCICTFTSVIIQGEIDINVKIKCLLLTPEHTVYREIFIPILFLPFSPPLSVGEF